MTGRAVLAIALLAACGDNLRPGTSGPGDGSTTDDAIAGDASDASTATMPDAHQNGACADPAPPSVLDRSIVVAVPSDFDATAAPTPTTRIAFSVLLPQRCPGDRFPLVLHAHGYGGERIRAPAPDGTLHPESPHFGSIDALVRALPHHGYVVISFDERGHGESVPANGGGYARIIDPAAETRDARAILDWAFDHAAEHTIETQPSTGIAKDVRVGTIGYSYGGGYQFPLAALDARIDTLVPNGTWHDLLYSLMPGDAVKLSYDGLLCLLAETGGVQNTPMIQTMCNAVGIQGLEAQNARSRSDLARMVSSPTARPRSVTEAELVGFLERHGMGWFTRRQTANQAWGFGETSAHLRPVPMLLLQGNRDVLFNLTEAMWNARYFAATGADVRLLSTEGGHMNPLALQKEGTASCGTTRGVDAVLAWLDRYLKEVASPAFDAIPKTCVSVADTANAETAAAAGLVTDRVLVGSQTGTGAVTATLATASANLPLGTTQVFVPVVTISGANRVLAGVPTLGRIVVSPGAGALQSTNAFVGVGIRRGSTTFLVDDQVTGFAVGTHERNRNVLEDDRVLLPAVGEQLRDGDVVGLLVMSQHVQYAAVISASAFPGAPGVVTYVSGQEVPPITSGLNPVTGLTYINPLSVQLTDVQLPIVVPGQFPNSALSR